MLRYCTIIHPELTESTRFYGGLDAIIIVASQAARIGREQWISRPQRSGSGKTDSAATR